MALSVIAVSIRVSPFLTALVATDMLMTSPPQALAGQFERCAGACRGLEEEVEDGAPAQGRLLLVGLAILFDVRFGTVEENGDLGGRKTFDSQQVTMREIQGVRGGLAHKSPTIRPPAPPVQDVAPCHRRKTSSRSVRRRRPDVQGALQDVGGGHLVDHGGAALARHVGLVDEDPFDRRRGQAFVPEGRWECRRPPTGWRQTGVSIGSVGPRCRPWTAAGR